MKKYILSAILLIVSFSIVSAQKVDTVLNMGNYTVLYSYSIKAPLLEYHNLNYKGDKDCNRLGKTFTCGDLCKYVARNEDYNFSPNDTVHYDRGHLASFQDFSDDEYCLKAQNTFFMWNCFPQTSALRGPWKTLEKKIRDISKTEQLLVLTGGFYNDVEIGNNVHVPYECWKIVYSYDRKKVIIAEIFTNTKTPTQKSVNWKKYIKKRLVKMDVKLNISKIIKSKI